MVPFPPGQKPHFPDLKTVPRVNLGDADTFGPYFATKIFNDAIRTDDAVTDAAARWLRAHHEEPLPPLGPPLWASRARDLGETAEQGAARIPTEYVATSRSRTRRSGRLVRKLGTLALRDRVLLIVHADHA